MNDHIGSNHAHGETVDDVAWDLRDRDTHY
jgi:hypothetical protein